jgi:hypothetical protein
VTTVGDVANEPNTTTPSSLIRNLFGSPFAMFVVTKKILLSDDPVIGLSINILPLNIDEPNKSKEPITSKLPEII